MSGFSHWKVIETNSRHFDNNIFQKRIEKRASWFLLCRCSVYGRGIRMLEPNTYECPIRTIRTYWAEILIFDKKMSCSAQYVRMAMTLKILQVLIILPLKIYKFPKDNSTHGNFVQGQLDPRQFRPRTTRPTAISTKDNSTNGNFVHIQSWLSLQG